MHDRKGWPHFSTFEEVKTGKFNRQGYVIYVMYDDLGHCCYVGQSKNPRQRFLTHQCTDQNAPLQLMISLGKISRVDIFTADLWAYFIFTYMGYPRKADAGPVNPDDYRDAREAEKFFIERLRPYLNDKNGGFHRVTNKFSMLYLDNYMAHVEMLEWGVTREQWIKAFEIRSSNWPEPEDCEYCHERILAYRENNARSLPWSIEKLLQEKATPQFE